jgi:hypothetical protein
MRTRRPQLALFAALISLGAAVGCGEGTITQPTVPTYAVTGKILLPDGKPLTEGQVTFTPTKKDVGRVAMGKVQPDGSFVMTTYKPEDGVAEGEYDVAINSDQTVPDPSAKAKKRMVLPSKYREGGAGLIVNIKPQKNDLPPFQLDNKAAASAEKEKEDFRR